MRINKFLRDSGVTSRRGADELIASGRVSVNGKRIMTPGVEVEPDKDEVAVDGKIVRPCKGTYVVLFSKPCNVTTTLSDPHAKKTVADYFCEFPVRLFPVGRLDQDTSGLLIMTNDGDLAYKLTHPKFEKTKTYLASCAGILERCKIEKLQKGICLEDGWTLPAVISNVHALKGRTSLEITIREGKNRQIRRMFDALGHPIIELRRIAIGSLRSPNMKDGTYRVLSSDEIRTLLKAPFDGGEKNKGNKPSMTERRLDDENHSRWRRTCGNDGCRYGRKR